MRVDAPEKQARTLTWDDEQELAHLARMRRGAAGEDADATFAGRMGVGGAAPLSVEVLESADRRTAVTEVDAGGFELNGDVFVPSSVACLAHSAFLWKARRPEDVTVESMRLFTAVHPRPEIVVLGLGAKGPRERLLDVELFFRASLRAEHPRDAERREFDLALPDTGCVLPAPGTLRGGQT